MSRLEGLRTLVVGGGSGIGRAVVEAFAAEGAAVGALDRDAEAVKALPHATVTAVADASRADEVTDAVTGSVAELGGLDALVHTAGVHDGFTTVEGTDPGALEAAAGEVFAANVTGAILAVRAAAPALRASSVGSITLTASESAFATTGGGPIYGASKWAVRGLVSSLSASLAPVRVNGVAPAGVTATALAGAGAVGGVAVGARSGRDEVIREATRLGVLIEPADVAAAYAYLTAPEESRAVTGTIINVDGGRKSA